MGELAAVADQHRIGIALHIGPKRAEDLRGMQPARRLRRDARPGGRAIVERGARLLQPAAVARFHRGSAADQRFGRAAHVRDAAQHEPPVHFLRGALDQRGLGIDRDQPHRRIERRAAHPLGGEIERLAEQNDQVGAAHQIGECAERRIRDAARAFEDDGGRLRRGFEPRQQRASAHIGKLRRREDDRPRRRRDCGQRCVRDGIAERRHRRRPRIRPHDRVALDALLQQVGRQAQMHRPRPTRGRDADRLADIAPERGCRRGGERGLAHGCCHVGLADFLKSAAAELPCRRMAGEQHHRRLRAERRVKRADRVGVARPARHHRDAGLAGEPPPRVRHVHGRRLMAHMHEIELRLDRGIEDRHDVVAGEREHAVAAEPRQRTRHDVGAAQRRFFFHLR